MVFDAPPAQATHAWMPSSPCGPGCIETTDRVGTARVIGRLFGVAGLLVSFPVLNVLTPPSRREYLGRRYARGLLGCLGMQLQVIDNRGSSAAGPVRYAEPGQGVLVVTGHIGWTDVVALAAVQPLGFVARADMLDWPLLGGLAKMMRVIPIERERLRELPDVVGQLADRLAAGDRVTVFPEGTTWCGRAYGTMRPALFQAAVDTDTPVQPVRLRYLDRHGASCTVPGFVGEDTFGSSAGRVLRAKGMLVEITLEPVEKPGSDRRDLARRCELAVRGAELSRHGLRDTEWIEAGTTRVLDPAPALDAELPVAAPARQLPGVDPRANRRGGRGIRLWRGRRHETVRASETTN